MTLCDIFEDNWHFETFCVGLIFLDRGNLLNCFSDVKNGEVFPELTSLDLSVV